METEESTSVPMVIQPAHTPQHPHTPSVPILPVPVSTPKQLSTPSRYQLEIPKLSIPSRLPTIRTSISYSPTSFQSPVFKVPTNRPRSNLQIPTLAISTPPRPPIPLLHTPIQQRPRLLSFITRSTPQVTLSAPNIRPTLATSQSSSVQAPITTLLQAGSNQAPMQTMSSSQATSTQDSVVEMDSQTLQQEPDGFELSSTSQESTSFATLFTSDSGHECTDYDGGDFGQTGNNQESSVNDQLEVCHVFCAFHSVLSFPLFFPSMCPPPSSPLSPYIMYCVCTPTHSFTHPPTHSTTHTFAVYWRRC